MISAAPTRYAFSVDEWHRMGEAGLFDEDSRVELLDGDVVTLSPIGNRQLACVNRLTRLLVVAVGEQAIVSVQNPVRLDDHSEPQSDLALLHPRLDDDDDEATPRADDTFLIVEVAESSLAWDRDRKAPRFAPGSPGCWIVDLIAGEILVLGGPGPTGYRDLHRAVRGETLHVPGLPSVVLSVDDVLGPC